ncbi:MAG: hypothetical protein AAF689_08325 [Pseudomonadota bacterium]
MLPIGDAEDGDHHANRRPRKRQDQKSDKREGDRDLRIHCAHDHILGPTAAEPCDQPQGGPDQHADAGPQKRQRQGQPQAIKRPAQHIAAKLIGAKHMPLAVSLKPKGRAQPGDEALIGGIERRNERREQRHRG